MAAAASELQRLLEAEGATFHPALRAGPIPAMGGGMGIVAASATGGVALTPGTVVARLPFRSMVTVKKARINLAMAEVAIEALGNGSSSSSSGGGGAGASPFPHGAVPFIALPFPEEGEATEGGGGSGAVSSAARAAIENKAALLERRLCPTDTIACYLLLMAALYGRWDRAAEGNSTNDDDDIRGDGNRGNNTAQECRPVLPFSHENAWMGRWIRCLPSAYDNLLELGIRGGCPSPPLPTDGTAAASTSGTSTTTATATTTSNVPLIADSLAFPRHRAKTALEQAALWGRFEHCLGLLGCLRCLPLGVHCDDTPSLSTPSPYFTDGKEAVTDSGTATGASMEQYLWAFNTVMSRGFFFAEDTWALMPYVDYFNYALESNATMQCKRCTVSGSGTVSAQFTNVLSSLRSRLTSGSGGGGGSPSSPSLLCFSSAHVYCFDVALPVAADEQVMLHYGAYSDFELLMWYGFTLSPFLRPQLPLSSTSTYLSSFPSSSSSSCVDADRQATVAELQDPEQRWRLFLRHKGVPADSAAAVAAAAAVASMELERGTGNEEDGRNEKEDREEEEGDAAAAIAAGRLAGAYETWVTALQRSYCHVLSPLADTDGNYPTTAAETGAASWLAALVADFRAIGGDASAVGQATTATTMAGGADVGGPPLVSSPSSPLAAAVHHWASFFAADWAANAAARDRLVTLQGLDAAADNGPAALGVLGPSAQMEAALRLLASSRAHAAYLAAHPPPTAVPRGTHDNDDDARPMSLRERIAALRAVAWMELATAAGVTTATTGGGPFIVSTAAAAMAAGLSGDARALLRFLAVEASDAQLERYLAREPSY